MLRLFANKDNMQFMETFLCWWISYIRPYLCAVLDLYIPLMGFVILGFKLKKNDSGNGNDKKNELFAISHMFVVQFEVDIHLTLSIIQRCQK